VTGGTKVYSRKGISNDGTPSEFGPRLTKPRVVLLDSRKSQARVDMRKPAVIENKPTLKTKLLGILQIDLRPGQKRAANTLETLLSDWAQDEQYSETQNTKKELRSKDFREMQGGGTFLPVGERGV